MGIVNSFWNYYCGYNCWNNHRGDKLVTVRAICPVCSTIKDKIVIKKVDQLRSYDFNLQYKISNHRLSFMGATCSGSGSTPKFINDSGRWYRLVDGRLILAALPITLGHLGEL